MSLSELWLSTPTTPTLANVLSPNPGRLCKAPAGMKVIACQSYIRNADFTR
jgi:hypothetical protein